ncbi:hypothetical protein [Nocardioides stalactiti]|uniref:hypothetical protein n=1 Tax=Nocardioides stalactiti TaxID=2755356 RepID=UPI001601FB59|nr:hypothetical protein [Nocardioides stalactiti]
MTDEPDEQLDPVPPEDEARLRALLSDARETAPMPAAVAARLDDTLLALAAERGVTAEPVPADNVVPLERTRRHRVAAVLGAAAAVAVLGLGVGTFFDSTSQGESDSAGASNNSLERGDDGSAAEFDVADDAPTEAAESPHDEDGIVVSESIADFQVRSRHLVGDLLRLRVALDGLRDGTTELRYGSAEAVVPDAFTCSPADFGRGLLVGVTYDSTPALVAFRDPMGSSQVVEVLQCGTGDVLRSTTLPTRG